MNVEEIMTENVRTIDETASLSEALEILSEMEIRHLPVTEGGELKGMLTDRDLRSIGLDMVVDLQSLDDARARLQTPVSSLMTGDPTYVGTGTDVREAIDMMLEERISAVPVIDLDTKELVGIVSYVDLLRAARDLFE